MPNDFQYDVFLSYSSKDKAVVRPLAERLRKDGLNRFVSALHHSAFILLPSLGAPIKGCPGAIPLCQTRRALIHCCRWN
jgi:hypothetical protein